MWSGSTEIQDWLTGDNIFGKSSLIRHENTHLNIFKLRPWLCECGVLSRRVVCLAISNIFTLFFFFLLRTHIILEVKFYFWRQVNYKIKCYLTGWARWTQFSSPNGPETLGVTHFSFAFVKMVEAESAFETSWIFKKKKKRKRAEWKNKIMYCWCL